jgi:hypothetical protein
MSTVLKPFELTCPDCKSRRDWCWEEAFDKFGFDDGDGVVMTGDVAKALEGAGYAVRVECWGLHNVVITSFTRDGLAQIPDGTSIGYGDPREYLPQELVDFLDRTFGQGGAS